jgi:subtilisin family serine protease
MKQKFLTLTMCLLVMTCLAGVGQDITPKHFVDDEVLVKFAPKIAAAERDRIVGAVGGKLVDSLDFSDVWKVQLPRAGQVLDAVLRLQQERLVRYAEPNFIGYADSTIFPNDPSFKNTFGLHNTGQTGGVADADIDAPEAWSVATGSSDIIVAMTDSGVDYNHPDLVDNMWINPGEIPNNNIDDDGNGYVDDVYGYNFYDNTSNPIDDYGHGTHVAGTVGAVGNNGIGVAGVCWKVKLMSAKWIGWDGWGDTFGAAKSIEYATENGAKVITASWHVEYSQALYDTLRAAGEAGVLFVAAAGNDSGLNLDNYSYVPAGIDLDNIIGVAASTSSDTLASFSNYGPNSVELAAPGAGIYSTMPNNSYYYLDGTSMAVPHVAGAAALLLSVVPDLGYANLKMILTDSVDQVPAFKNLVISGGRLNIANALDFMLHGDFLLVSPAQAVLKVKEQRQISVHNGTAPFIFTTKNPYIISVDAEGLIRANHSGVGTIVVSDQTGKNAEITMNVIPADIQPFTISSNDDQIRAGETVTFTANGGTAPYVWEVADAAFGKITSEGIFRADKEGAVVIRAIAADAIFAEKIFQIDPVEIVVTPDNLYRLKVGQTYQFQATGGFPPYTWSHSGFPWQAQIDQNGLLTIKRIGPEFRVYATDSRNNYGMTYSLKPRRLGTDQ